ncbi:hypothetical protein BGZ60DRAFT_421368 [Tricladium varicosporioides]|nr:hypothetical protein BGZ60DRAFT_421368 [Hymenoscyphus varicosporioides]
MATLELNIEVLSYPDSRLGEGSYLENDHQIFLILRDFLQPYSSILFDTAVQRVFTILTQSHANFRSFNSVCLELAEQIPYHHPSQLKLTRLVWLMGRNRGNDDGNSLMDTPAARISYYQHLLEDATDNCSDPGADGTDPKRYVNYQAFLANLVGFGLWLPNPAGALYAMRGAFEEDHEGEPCAIRSAWFMGAAQWILWNGQELFKLVLLSESLETEERMHVTHNKWKGWIQKFEEVASSADVDQECRAVTARAAELMAVMESKMGFINDH